MLQNPAFGGWAVRRFDQRVRSRTDLGCCVLGTMALSIPIFHATRGVSAIRWSARPSASGHDGALRFIGAAVTNATMVIFGTRIADPVALLARIGGPLMIILSMAGLTVATLTTNIAANIVAPATPSRRRAAQDHLQAGAMITAVIGIVICVAALQ